MKKSISKIITVFSLTAVAGFIAVTINPKIITGISASSCTHNGYHYNLKNATTTENGYFEFWTCCKCHEHFLTKPNTGTYIDSSTIYSGGIPADVILPAGSKYYAKGSQISGDSNFDPKVNDLSLLDNKAISFNFKMTENGSVGLVLFDSEWANVTGNIVFTKNNDSITTNKGLVTEKDNGWYNVVINKSEFDGDGLSRANNISIVAGLWGGSATVTNTVPLAVNWSTFAITEQHRSLVTGNDVLQPFGVINSSELTNKALSFDVYYGGAGDQTVKYSIYKDGWDERFIADIFVKRVGKNIEVRQFDPNGVVIPSVIETSTDNWVNVKINAEYLNIESALGNKIIVWANPTGSNNGLDISSFKIVDATSVKERNYAIDTSNIQPFNNIIMMKDLINAGGYAFNIKMSPNTSSKISFMNGNWSNFGTSYFVCDADSNITCFHDAERTCSKGNLTKLTNGWTRVIFNEFDFYGDGRSAVGAEGINYIFVENGSISFDENSCGYVAPYVQSGMSYASGTTIERNSWDGNHHNFAYTKEKVIKDTSVFSFDFKPVGNGSIDFALLADTWANITGPVTINVTNNQVTTNYPDGIIIPRLDGWYSIYLPSPMLGDGVTSSWEVFSKFYSANGYSGTNFTINFGSIHLANTDYLGGTLDLTHGDGYTLNFNNIGASYYLVKDDNDYRDSIRIEGDSTEAYFSYTPEVVGKHKVYVEAYDSHNQKMATSKKIDSVEIEPVFSYSPFSAHYYIKHENIAQYGITEALWNQAAAAQGEGKDAYYFFLDDNLNWTIHGAVTSTSDFSKQEEIDFSNSPYLDTIFANLKGTGQNVLLLHTKYAYCEQYSGWSWWSRSESDNCLKRYMDAAWKVGMKCIISDAAIMSVLNQGTTTAEESQLSSLRASVKTMVSNRILHTNNGESNFKNFLFHKGLYGINVPDEPFYNSKTMYAIGYASETIDEIYANNPEFRGRTKPILHTSLLPYSKYVFNSDSEYQSYIEQWLSVTKTNYFSTDIYNYTTTNYGTYSKYSNKKFCPIKSSYTIYQNLRNTHPGLKITQVINSGNIIGAQTQTTEDIFASHLITAAAKFNGYGLFTFSPFDLSGEWTNEAVTVKQEKTAYYPLFKQANEQVVRLKGLLSGYDISSMTFDQNPTNGYGSGTKKMTVNYQRGDSTKQMIVNYETDASASANFNVTIETGKKYIMFGYNADTQRVLDGTGNSVTLTKGTGILIF